MKTHSLEPMPPNPAREQLRPAPPGVDKENTLRGVGVEASSKVGGRK